MEHVERKTSGKKCWKCHNNIAVNSNTYGAEGKVAHLHCLPPSKRK